MDKFYFLLFNTSLSQFFTSTYYFYVHIYMRFYVCTCILISIFNFKNRNLNTCYFLSPLPFLYPLLQVALVGPGWGRTSTGTQARPGAHFPLSLTPLSWVLLRERRSVVQYYRANEWQCPGHRILKAGCSGQVSPQQLPHDGTTLGYSSLALYKWGTIGASRICRICYKVDLSSAIYIIAPTSIPYQYLLRNMGLTPLPSLLA